MADPLVAIGVTVDLGGRTVLGDVDLRVGAGEIVGVVGPNGSGKSTLLRALYGAQALRAGTIHLNGRPLPCWSRPAIARQVAVVAQEPPPELPLKVEELVLLGRLPHRCSFGRWTGHDRATAARAVALTDIAHLVGRPVWNLSGGERQRVLIARAIAQGTDVMLWDEPTNHLDLRHAHDSLALLCRLGLAGVVVLHDLNLAARYCDRLVVLHAGRTAAEGTAAAVCTPELIAEVFGVGATPVDHDDTVQLLYRR